MSRFYSYAARYSEKEAQEDAKLHFEYSIRSILRVIERTPLDFSAQFMLMNLHQMKKESTKIMNMMLEVEALLDRMATWGRDAQGKVMDVATIQGKEPHELLEEDVSISSFSLCSMYALLAKKMRELAKDGKNANFMQYNMRFITKALHINENCLAAMLEESQIYFSKGKAFKEQFVKVNNRILQISPNHQVGTMMRMKFRDLHFPGQVL